MKYDPIICSTNNWVGWLHYYAAHLITRCGIERDQVETTILETSKVACVYQKNTGSLSDNQCIMVSNRWFFCCSDLEDGKYFYVNLFDRDFSPTKLDWDYVDWWIKHI